MIALQSAEIRVGTRGSPLALVQANATRRAVAAAAGMAEDAVAIVPIRTTGDRITDRPLLDVGGKGLFTREIDEALLDSRIDVAVHSSKDMPTRLPDGMSIAACLPRADVRDAFLSRSVAQLEDLPTGAILGTSSLRRAAFARRARPDLRVVDLRGNVETRIRRLDEGAADAILLAHAGLLRLGLADRVSSLLDPERFVPAAGQGIIALVARDDDAATRTLLARIDDAAASIALAAERAFLTVLDGSCRTPIGAYARLDGDRIAFHGAVVKPDGSEAHEVRREGPAADAARIGADAGAEIAARGGAGFFAVV